MKKVSEYLRGILAGIMEDSGYPYPPDSAVDPNRAFAYGLTAGTLSFLIREWEDKEAMFERESATKPS